MGEVISLILGPILNPPQPPGVDTNGWRFSLVLFLVTLWITYKTFFPSLSDNDLKEDLAASGADLRKLGDDYDRLVADIHAKLRDLVEKQMDWVQHSLNEEVWHFGSFLDRVRRTTWKLGGLKADHALANPFARFVNRWLAVFQECSSHPVEKPRIVVEVERLSACKTVTEVCDEVLESLTPDPLRLVEHARHNEYVVLGHMWEDLETSLMRPFDLDNRGLDGDATIDLRNGCTWINILWLNKYYVGKRTTRLSWLRVRLPLQINVGVLKVVILSEKHLMLILILFITYVWTVHEICAGSKITAGIGLLVVVMVTTALFHFERLDEMGELAVQTAQIQIDTHDLKKRHQEVSVFFNNIDRLSDLWTYRTRPVLGIMKNLHVTLATTTWPSCDAAKLFLEFVDSALADQWEQLGSLQFWVTSDRMLSEKACRLIRQELERCRSALHGEDAMGIMRSRRHFDVLNLVAVRILGASQLEIGNIFGGTDAYVQVRVGRLSEWQRTEYIPNSTEPRWHYDGTPAEFCINLPLEPYSPLLVEVRSQSFTDTFLGSVEVDFRKFGSGKWHRLIFELEGVEKGEIELEVYYAKCAEQLVGVVPAIPPPGLESEPPNDEDEDEDAAASECSNDEGAAAGDNSTANSAAAAASRNASAESSISSLGLAGALARAVCQIL